MTPVWSGGPRAQVERATKLPRRATFLPLIVPKFRKLLRLAAPRYACSTDLESRSAFAGGAHDAAGGHEGACGSPRVLERRRVGAAGRAAPPNWRARVSPRRRPRVCD